jgi:hypothetical protein
MTFFFDRVNGGFYSESFHGTRTVQVPDPAWKAPDYLPHDPAPQIEIANPACALPPAEHLVALSDDDYQKLMDGQSQGKQIAVHEGRPVLVDPPAWTVEQIAASVRRQRDALLAPVADALQRDLLQKAYHQPATLSDAQANALAVYAQALRDVPQQAGFPASVIWPEPPAPTDSTPATTEA